MSTQSLREGRAAMRTMIAAGVAPTGGPFDGWDPINNPKDPLIIIDHGTRTFRALVAPFNSCILNGRESPGVCRKPPRDDGGYDYAHTGGDIGIIGRGMDHAASELSASAAAAHYANTGTATFLSHYYEDEEAIWAMGLLMPNVTDDDIVHLEASALSGDWRWIDEERRLRMIASQCVSTPGFRPAYVDRYQFSMAASATVEDHEQSLITTWESSAPTDSIRGTVADMSGTTNTATPCSCQHPPAGEVVTAATTTPATVEERLARLEQLLTELAESLTAAPAPATVVAPAPAVVDVTPPAVPAPVMTAPITQTSTDVIVMGLDERITAIEEVVASIIADNAQLQSADWAAQDVVAQAPVMKVV